MDLNGVRNPCCCALVNLIPTLLATPSPESGKTCCSRPMGSHRAKSAKDQRIKTTNIINDENSKSKGIDLQPLQRTRKPTGSKWTCRNSHIEFTFGIGRSFARFPFASMVIFLHQILIGRCPLQNRSGCFSYWAEPIQARFQIVTRNGWFRPFVDLSCWYKRNKPIKLVWMLSAQHCGTIFYDKADPIFRLFGNIRTLINLLILVRN